MYQFKIPLFYPQSVIKFTAIFALFCVLCIPAPALAGAGFFDSLFGPSAEQIRAENERLLIITAAQERAAQITGRGCSFEDAYSERLGVIEDRIKERVSYAKLSGRYDRVKDAYYKILTETDRQKAVIVGLAADELLYRRLSCVLFALCLLAGGWAWLTIRDRRHDRAAFTGYLYQVGIQEPERIIDAVCIDHNSRVPAVRGVRYGR